MTHLVIELPTTGIEQVSSSVIEKLYNLAVSGDLDASSNLLGRLSVNATYLEYIDELEGQFDELYITANKIYINFADDAVKSALMSVYGDGIGISSSDVNTNYLNKSFKNNTSIRTFDELSQFTGVTLLTNLQFMGASNLSSIDTSRITRVGDNCITNTKITSLDLSSLTNIGGANAFSGNTLLTSVDFGQNSSLTALGSTAFGGCTSLQTITIPTTITTIPDYCFYNDNNLTTISGTSNVTSIGGAAFENCSKLTTIDISSVTALAWNSFKGCSKLNNITLNSGLTSIPSNCFNGCTSLTSIDLSNVTSIGNSAFIGCTGLTTLDTSSCTSIGNCAFEGCTSLTTVDASNVTTLGHGVFYGCTNLLSLDLSNYDFASIATNYYNETNTKSPFALCSNLTTIGVTTIPTTSLRSFLFDYCGLLQGELNFPNVTSVSSTSGGCLFRNCGSITKLTFGHIGSVPPGNKWLSRGMFRNCSSLKILDLGDSITSIGDQSMDGCASLKAVLIRTTTPPTALGSDISNLFTANSTTIYVPRSAVSTYLQDALFGPFNIESIEDDYNESTILGTA